MFLDQKVPCPSLKPYAPFACSEPESINGNPHNYILTVLGVRNAFSGQILPLTGHALTDPTLKHGQVKNKKNLKQNKRDAA